MKLYSLPNKAPQNQADSFLPTFEYQKAMEGINNIHLHIVTLLNKHSRLLHIRGNYHNKIVCINYVPKRFYHNILQYLRQLTFILKSRNLTINDCKDMWQWMHEDITLVWWFATLTPSIYIKKNDTFEWWIDSSRGKCICLQREDGIEFTNWSRNYVKVYI